MPENFEPKPDEAPEQDQRSPEQIAREERINNILEEYKREMDALIKKTDELVELEKTNPDKYREIRKEEDKERRKKRSETSNKKVLKLRQDSEKLGLDLEDEETLIDLGVHTITGLNQLFGEKYGISVSPEKIPVVLPFDTNVPFYAEPEDENGKKTPIIAVGTANHILNGNYISEELAHFYRFQLRPEQKDEWLTHEFFGFLGRKLFKKAVAEGAKDFEELDNEEGQGLASKKEIVNLLKRFKTGIRLFREQLEKATTEGEKFLFQYRLDEFTQMREDIIRHRRGYEYAFSFDVDKITDWRKLFSMPNEEVRKRFFTDNPNYSGL